MARYNLIFKDSAYFELMKIAQEKKISMGKLLNNIINDYVKDNSKNPELFKTGLCRYPTMKKKKLNCERSRCPMVFKNPDDYDEYKKECEYVG